jgi:hypothetical protein
VKWSTFNPRDWLALGELAEQHGVAPLAYWHLERAGWPDSTPAELPQRLATSYYQSAAGSALILRDLRAMLTALQEAGVEVILLKGAHLAYSLYPEAALRPMTDIDLLVREADLPAAERAMAGCGYHPSQATVSERLNRRQGHHLHLSKGGGASLPVELHWSLLAGREDRRQVDAGWFWERGVAISLEGVGAASGLDPTANLLYLAAHLFLKHQGGSDRLVWLYDIALLLEKRAAELDWATALAQAEALGWGEALHAALRAAQDELGAEVPSDVLEELATRYPTAYRKRAFRNFSKAEMSLANLEQLTPGGRLRMGWAALFPSREHMVRRYQPKPKWLWPLCYPLKWWGMVREGSGSLFESAKLKKF